MKRLLSFALVFILVVGTLMPMSLIDNANAASKDVSILFTHDMHSHLNELAKIKTIKGETEEKYKGTFLLDGGDFSMGTPFQTIYRSEAAELKTMAAVGYDATTLGNHEFDYKAEGLAAMLNSAAEYESGDDIMPAVVGTNINWDKTLNDEETKKAGKKLKKAFENYGVADYTIIEKNGIKMAVFGLIGDEAISNAPEAGVVFSDYVKRAETIVEEIKQNGEANIVVALSHAGINEEEFSQSEDVKLAEAVDGIDVIISAHSHTKLPEAKTVNGTVIVASGEYADNIGHLVLSSSDDGYKVKDYDIIKLDDKVEDDKEILSMVKGFKSDVNKEYFSKYNMNYDQVLAKSDFSFIDIENFGIEQKEEPLANLIADSYSYGVKKAEGKDYEKVDVSIIPAGTVRSSFGKGDITVADAFNVSSLGMGADGTVGYPVVSIYLTGRELEAAAEVDASISPSMDVARLYMSGLGYTINDHRLFLNRATDVKLIDNNGKEIKDLENDKLYRVVGGLYSCQMLSLVKEQSHGLLSIEPKDKNGKVIKDFTKHIVKDKEGKELKEWYALASYIDSFKDGKVPAYYKTTHDRKIIDNSWNPIKLIKQPNNIAVMLLAILLIPVVIIAGIVIFIIKRRNERRGFARSMFSGSRNRTYKRTVSSRSRRPYGSNRRVNTRGRRRRF